MLLEIQFNDILKGWFCLTRKCKTKNYILVKIGGGGWGAGEGCADDGGLFSFTKVTRINLILPYYVKLALSFQVLRYNFVSANS